MNSVTKHNNQDIGYAPKIPDGRHTAKAPRLEKQFKSSAVVRDIVIGMSDGLTVPFALAAGLTGAVTASHTIIAAGLAEVAAGSIAMGLGGYLAARGEEEHYGNEREREQYELQVTPEVEAHEVAVIFQTYGLTQSEINPIIDALTRKPESYVDFMMRFELGMLKPEPGRSLTSALTIAGSYISGGIVALCPYLLLAQVHDALIWSVVVTLFALAAFGFFKAKATGAPPVQGALNTVLIGGVAAAAAFVIARAVSGSSFT